jgi:Tfp pilus assembly protein PilO
LEKLAQIAGIRRNQVQYELDPVPAFGVYSVRINIPVQGPYEAVTRFIRELEVSDRVFILDSIGLNRAQLGGPDNLELSLNLTTFFSYGS